MIELEFDVHGRNASKIIEAAVNQAREFVGGRDYKITMIRVNPRVGVFGEDRPLDYVAEVHVECPLP